MKTLPIIAAIGLTLTSFRFTDNLLPSGTISKSSTNAYTAAVKVTKAEFDALTADYASSSGSTLGGMMGKSELKNFISSIPGSQDFVRFRFCTDPTYSKTSLMLKGDHTLLRNTQYMRNGGSDESFCPTMCSLESTATKVSIDINASAYETLSTAYSEANAGKTLGGKIEKSALLEIVNSLPVSATTVAFRFCTVGGNTCVIFAGGNVGQEGGSQLFYRNGGSPDSFCPTMCD
ncbi:MAG: hypothetical protein JNL57_11650 [Bacteroidetes bacterium]|nr:hypothetical protein [Bacteroidota bacterium]